MKKLVKFKKSIHGYFPVIENSSSDSAIAHYLDIPKDEYITKLKEYKGYFVNNDKVIGYFFEQKGLVIKFIKEIINPRLVMKVLSDV